MLSVLVIEDDKTMRNLLCSIITKSGYAADSAENGLDGLEKALSGDYNRILMDLMLYQRKEVWYNVSIMNRGKIYMDRKKKIVGIVEDEEQMRTEVANLIRKYGYDAVSYTDFEYIMEAVEKNTPDLLLLDVNLPYKDGYEICREIREKYAFPIIMLTAQNSVMDEVMGLKCGADDFIAKPYHPQVLAAHIETVLRRTSQQQSGSTVTHKGVTLDTASAVITCQDRSAELTRNELKILYVLMQKPDRIVAREEIMNGLWQEGQFIDENTLNVNIGRLRKKLADIGAPDYLETKRGMGYKV